MSIENFVMEWLPVIFLKSRSLAWLRGDLISPTATFAFPPCFGLVGDLQA